MTLTRNRQPHRIALILMLGALNTITPLSIDMYLPAFPQIAASLHTTTAKVALSVSTYLLGFAIGQVMYGPLLDRFGRKPPLYAGLFLYILACAGCMLAPTIEIFFLCRFLQALGGCVASVAALAMVRDLFSTKESAGVLSLMMLILGVSPMLAPTLGSLMVSLWSWQIIFLILAIIAAVVVAFIFFFLPEPHQPDHSISLKVGAISKSYLVILTQPVFYIYAFAGSFSFAGLFAYVAGSPAIFMDDFQVGAKVYGIIFALLSVGFIGGSQVNMLLTKRFTSRTIFQTIVITQLIIAVLFCTGSFYHLLGLKGTVAFLFALLACTGLTYPNAASMALSSFKKNAGSAAALLGFIQIGIGSIVSSGVGFINSKGSLATAVVMVLSSLIAIIIIRTNRLKITEGELAI